MHGLCLTAGLELALACDLLWASDDARFGLAERAGSARAREFVMSGALYGADELHRWVW